MSECASYHLCTKPPPGAMGPSFPSSENTRSPSTIDIPFIPFLLLLMAYPVAISFIQQLLRHLTPGLFYQLQKDERKKLNPFCVFVLGILFTVTTTPFCVAAAISSPDEKGEMTGRGGAGWFSGGAAEKVCIATRASMWLSELPFLNVWLEYTMHHYLSLTSLLVVSILRAPPRPMCIVYAGLGTEVLSDGMALLKIQGAKLEGSRFLRRLTWGNVAGIVVLRIGGGLLALGLLLRDMLLIREYDDGDDVDDMALLSRARSPTANSLLICIGCVVFYLGYMFFLVWRHLASFGVVELVMEKPARLDLFGGKKSISVFSLTTAASLVISMVSALAVYLSQTAEPTVAEIEALASIVVQGAAVGLIGARATSALLRSSCLFTFTSMLTSRGLYLQGGLLAGGAFVGFKIVNREDLDTAAAVGALALTLPLGEAVGRAGCVFAGCCGAVEGYLRCPSPDRETIGTETSECRGKTGLSPGPKSEKTTHTASGSSQPRCTPPVVSIYLNLLAYFICIQLWNLGYLTLIQSSIISIACQAQARVLAESQRHDIPSFHIFRARITPTKIMAYFQLTVSWIALTWASSSDAIFSSGLVLMTTLVLGTCYKGLTAPRAAQRQGISRLGVWAAKPIVIVSFLAAVLAVGVGVEASRGAVEVGYGPHFLLSGWKKRLVWETIMSHTIWLSSASLVLLPVTLINLFDR